MKAKTVFLLMLALTLVSAGGAWGASDTKDVTISATVSSAARLTLGTTTVTFPDADPDDVKSIAAKENGAAVTAKIKTGSATSATLQVLAMDDLKSDKDTIAITNITSTATNTTGSFFTGGPVTWSKTAPGATVGQGNSGSFVGAFSWFLANSWDYPTGNYTTKATYTLTAP